MTIARHLIVILFVSHSVGCLDGEAVDIDDDEPALTATELAELPDAVADADGHGAAWTDDAPLDDDAGTFDTDEIDASALDDVSDIADDAADLEAEPLDEAVAADAPVALAAARPLLKWGLHQRASDALRAAGVHANRIVQTIGNARASAGYHKRDGYFHGKPYTAAVDISVRGLSHKQIKNLIERLGKVGFAAWFRQNGKDGWRGVNHIHAVYARCKMKSVLRAQIRSWQVGRTGLSGNGIYHFHKFSHAAKKVVKAKFVQSRHGTSNR